MKTNNLEQFYSELSVKVGSSKLLKEPRKIRPYSKGIRIGGG